LIVFSFVAGLAAVAGFLACSVSVVIFCSFPLPGSHRFPPLKGPGTGWFEADERRALGLALLNGTTALRATEVQSFVNAAEMGLDCRREPSGSPFHD
jgi:hypothetical protein